MASDLVSPRGQGPAHCAKLTTSTPLAKLPTEYGEFTILAFGCSQPQLSGGGEHVAIMKGDVRGKGSVLLRVHSECLTGDVFGSKRCDCGEQLEVALRAIEAQGEGLVLYLRQEGRGIGLLNKVMAYNLQDKGADTVEANEILGYPADLRNYACAACALDLLGVSSVRLMTNNPKKIEELEKYGVKIVERVPIEVPSNTDNQRYMATKREQMGHLIGGRE